MKEIMMKNGFWIVAALLAVLAVPASADFLSADLEGAGGEGFASLTTGNGTIDYSILTSGVGTPLGAVITQGGAQVLDLAADFQFGVAGGSVTAAAALITQLENNTTSYTLVVQTAGGNLSGTLQNAGDSGGGGPGPTPQPGVLRFTIGSVTVNEGQVVTVQVSRTGGSSGAVGVTYASQGGTAAAGADFTAVNGTLTWADGESASKSFDVSTINDTAEEAAEAFTLVLSAPTGGATIAANGNLMEITISANDLGPCVASATRLCLPLAGPEAGRFSVDLHYKSVRAGGVEGDGAVQKLDGVGVTAGGLITMLDATNPEFLVKILDGCAITQAWWVFYAATTDLGFTLTVTDRLAAVTKTYTNEDLHAAAPVQDTLAFLTCSFN
jgi:Calx-beta domain